jgi:hypothetical protein
MAIIVDGPRAAPDAATIAQLEDYLAGVLYRLEQRLTELVDEKVIAAEMDTLDQLNKQFGGALEELEGRVDQRLQAMETRLAGIGEAIDAALQEANTEEEGAPDA